MTVSLGFHPIRILTVDDHPLMREGVASILRAEPGMELVAEAGTGQEAVERFGQHLPDVTVMDVRMPGLGGIDALIEIRQTWPDARVIMLSTYRSDQEARRALKAGARGYLLKSAVRTELLGAIRAVHAGGRHFSREIADELADHLNDEALSERELEVLRSVARGNTNRVVAEELSVGEDTIKAHLKRISSKLSARDRTHAVVIALKRGIIDLL